VACLPVITACVLDNSKRERQREREREKWRIECRWRSSWKKGHILVTRTSYDIWKVCQYRTKFFSQMFASTCGELL
jgi:hypothetical protein